MSARGGIGLFKKRKKKISEQSNTIAVLAVSHDGLGAASPL